MSLPLITPDGVVGAMNVYAHGKNSFDDRAAELGEIFATPQQSPSRTPTSWHRLDGWPTGCSRPWKSAVSLIELSGS
jgi:hypothetical protein